MDVGLDRFFQQSESLVEGFLKLFLTLHNAIGIGFILILLLQVGVVLLSLYMRPIRTRRQFFMLVLILFAGVWICSMTLWLMLETTGAQE